MIRPPRSSSSLVVAVYLPTLLLSTGQGVLVPTLPLYVQQAFGASFSLVSLAVAAAGIGTLLGDVPAGMLLEHYGRKPVMVAGTMSLAVATLALAVLGNLPLFVALRLVVGVGTAMWNISRMAYVTDVVPLRDRGRALSTFGGVNRIGTFVGPAIGGLAGSLFGLATPFYLSALLAAGAAAISLVWITETRHAEAGATRHMRWRIVGRLARQHWRELATAGSAQIFGQMIRAGRQIIVPLYGKDAIGLDVAQIGSIVSLSSAVDMTLFLPAGMLMDRLGRKFASVPSFIVLAVGMALVPLAHTYAGLLVASLVMGLGNGIGSGTMMTLGADLAPRRATGEFLGLWRLIGDTGSSAGPIAVGAIADAVGLSLAAFCLSGIGLLAAATLFLFVRETLVQPESAAKAAPARAGAP